MDTRTVAELIVLTLIGVYLGKNYIWPMIAKLIWPPITFAQKLQVVVEELLDRGLNPAKLYYNSEQGILKYALGKELILTLDMHSEKADITLSIEPRGTKEPTKKEMYETTTAINRVMRLVQSDIHENKSTLFMVVFSRLLLEANKKYEKVNRNIHEELVEAKEK